MKIFILDDGDIILKLQAKLLADAGHNVFPSSKSSSALEQIKASKLDCVITDIMMPHIDGI
jgi:CheY-like chemotaxis protein